MKLLPGHFALEYRRNDFSLKLVDVVHEFPGQRDSFKGFLQLYLDFSGNGVQLEWLESCFR